MYLNVSLRFRFQSRLGFKLAAIVLLILIAWKTRYSTGRGSVGAGTDILQKTIRHKTVPIPRKGSKE